MSEPILESFETRHERLWGEHTVRLRHRLHRHPMFSDEGLASLLDSLPRDRISITTMAVDGHRVDSWSYCDRSGRSGAEVLEAAKQGHLWIHMHWIHEVDRRYGDLLEEIFAELEQRLPRFRTFRRTLGLLLSSPRAQVFYHADPPGQTLWQLRGRKRIYLYPPSEVFLRPEELESVIRGVTEEELSYEPWYDEYAEVHDLEPGDMLVWKLNAPHRVLNEDCLNVSLTTEHWTPHIRRSYAMNYGNGVLRRELGWVPLSRGLTGPAFWAKVGLAAAWRFSRLRQRSSYHRTLRYRIDPSAPHGVVRIEG